VRTGACVQAVGVLTGWGEGVAALPADARAAATTHPVIRLTRPPLDGERFRRATRECLLGVAAVQQMLSDADLDRGAIAGSRTALLFVTAGAYGASNVEFIAGRAGTLHFPYTAPSALSAEVAIEFGLTGAYVILIGGPATTVDALWQASRLLQEGRCDRALVLAVETFDECEDLWRRARWVMPAPLVEAAVCALLVPRARGVAAAGHGPDGALEAAAQTRAGSTLACGPLIALALAREAGGGGASVTGTWRGRRATIDVTTTGRAARS
jgi:hypothetical protein